MIVANKNGRPRKIKTPKALEELWLEYKAHCNGKTAVTTAFSQKSGEFVTAIIPKPVTYNIKGFCVFIGLTERDFYAVYDKDEKFQSVIVRMKEECEVDARDKFENGTLDSRLAGLWMSNYGYTTKAESKEEIKNSVVIVDDLDG